MIRTLFAGLLLAAATVANGWAEDVPEIRVGMIGLDTSHSVAFTKILNSENPPPELAGCRVVAAYPKGSPDIQSSVSRVPAYTEEVKKHGVKIVDSIETLVTMVDAVLLETNDGRPHLEQVRPVIRAGKPVFIDKPVAGSLHDAILIYREALAAGVPVFSSSSLRYGKNTQAVRGGSLGRVTHCETHSPASLEKTHPDLFWYGIHGVESLFTVMGTGCQSVTRSSEDGKVVVTGKWNDGRVGVFREEKGYGGTATGEQGESPVGESAGYQPLVVEIVKFFRTKQPPVSAEETLEIYAFMEAADESKRRGGEEVQLSEVHRAAGGFTPLFNGKDLSGWKGLVGNPKTRAAMSPEDLAAAQKEADELMREHWKVVDGVLEFDGKGKSLCTEKDYGDFEMYVDWKILEGGDSGIYLRGSPQIQIWDTEHPDYFRHGAENGSGALWNNKDNPRFPLVKADRPAGEWNTFYIRMVGDRVTVKLNGQLVTDNVVMENVWERDQPIYPQGQIELQNHGNKLWFRNIFLREIPAAEGAAILAAAEKKEPPSRWEAVRPEGEPIKLFNGKNLEGFYTWIRDSNYSDPKKVFTVQDGLLRVSGDGYGGLITNRAYRDYHLIIEFKWGEKTWGNRVDRARDSGLLLHCWGPDGNYSGTWMASVEAQIIEGGVGDILVLSGKDPQTGETLETKLTAEITNDRDGEKVWKKGGEKVTISRGRINWFGRDVDWADKVGFRGRDDVESPFGEWTRMEVIADGDHLLYKVNGVVVNEAFDVSPDFGKILLQTEQAEMFVRRYELWPLGKAPQE